MTYKPLTPDFRKQVLNSIEKQIAELKTCKPNAFVTVQIIGLQANRNLINALPDGYPMPVERTKE